MYKNTKLMIVFMSFIIICVSIVQSGITQDLIGSTTIPYNFKFFKTTSNGDKMIFSGYGDYRSGICIYDTKKLTLIQEKDTNEMLSDMIIPYSNKTIALTAFGYRVVFLDMNTLDVSYNYTTIKQPWPDHLGLQPDTIIDISDNGNSFFATDPQKSFFINNITSYTKFLFEPLYRVYISFLNNETFIAFYDGKINFWDVNKFEFIKSINCPDDYSGIGVYGHYAVLYNMDKGYEFLDLLNPEKGPVQKTSLPIDKKKVKIPKRGKYAVVQGSAETPRMLIDIEKNQITYSKSLKGSDDPYSEEAYDRAVEVTEDGTMMFVIKGNKVFIYDISKISSDTETGTQYSK